MPYKRSDYQNYYVAHEATVIKKGSWIRYAENQRLEGMKQKPLLKRGKKKREKKKEGKKGILVLFIFYTKIAKKIKFYFWTPCRSLIIHI